MAEFRAEFNIQQFEERNYTSPYLSEEQTNTVDLVENRVNDQLDWLAQLTGWNGSNYWSNLTSTVAEKRRLLGGSFGVYDKFIFPDVKAIRNWDNSKQISSIEELNLDVAKSQDTLWIEIEKNNSIAQGQTLYVGDLEYEILNVTTSADSYEIRISGDTSSFLDLYQSGEQIKVHVPEGMPAPFYRPKVQTSADESFICKSENGVLTLYPSYNTSKTLPYAFNTLIVGSTYYFDNPIYFSRTKERVVDNILVPYPVDVPPVYIPESRLWAVSIPEDYSKGEAGETGYLVWLYADSTNESFSVLEANLSRWDNPSDWDLTSVLNYYTGVWGNKGGPLPYNFVFDSLEISGFDEEKSLLLKPLENRVPFNSLLDFVYFQKAQIDPTPPKKTTNSQVWWDSQNGAFSVWNSSPFGCGSWDEILYPRPVESEPSPTIVFTDVSDFRVHGNTVAEETIIQINDISGLDPSDNIIGLLGELSGPGALILFRNEENYGVPMQFEYLDVLDFGPDAQHLPVEIPVLLDDSSGLGVPNSNYTVANLKISITERLPVRLLKSGNNVDWFIEPVSSLKYIGNTRLFPGTTMIDGELNWNFNLDDEETRRAVVFYYNRYEETFPGSGNWQLVGNWVDINTGLATSPPSASVDFGTILVYCNDVLVPEGEDAGFEDFNFSYEVDPLTGEFVFSYAALNYLGSVNLPRIVISDSLTTVYRYDISEYVFSGVQYYMSPNVLDAETPLRLWKTQSLQVKGERAYEDENNYPNALVADQNNGPSNEDWDRYFLRLPPRYGRNGSVWQKAVLVCQNLGYWGSPIQLQEAKCPPEDEIPRIYEQVYLFRENPAYPTILYSEAYIYSDVYFGETLRNEEYTNSGVLPAFEDAFDDFYEGSISSYEPLHNRRAIVDKPVGQGYGDWEGIYLRANECIELSGFVTKDLLEDKVGPIEPPLWDASIYKLPTSCEVNEKSYEQDFNHFKVGYAYFAADLSCAEDGFFDPWQEAAWRNPVSRGKTLYLANDRKIVTPKKKVIPESPFRYFSKTYGGIVVQQSTSDMGNWEVTDIELLGLYGVTAIGHFDAYCVGYPTLTAYLQDPAYRQKIFDYLDKGGVLWYLGEYYPCTDTVLSNTNLELLGTTIRLGNDAISSSTNVRVTDNPLFPINFFTSATNSLTGGTALYKELTSNKTVLAYEKIGNGVIVVSGDSNGTSKDPTLELYTALRSLV